MLGQYKIIYVAPERLLTDRFLELACTAPIDLLAVDEAHCVLAMGAGFPPQLFGYSRLCAKTAPPAGGGRLYRYSHPSGQSGTIQVLLQLQQPAVVTTGFYCKNLYYEVQHPKDKKAALLDCMGKYKGQSGIIYCATRRCAEEVCAFGRLRACRLPGTTQGWNRRNASKTSRRFLFDEAPDHGGHQRLWHGHRQIQRALRDPLQHAQGYGKLLPGSGPCRPGWGAGRVHPALQRPGCDATAPVPHRKGAGERGVGRTDRPANDRPGYGTAAADGRLLARQATACARPSCTTLASRPRTIAATAATAAACFNRVWT